MEYITLNTGAKMPMLGFGVFQITDAAICKQAVLDAIKIGYRLFDTAAVYGNEKAVGEAVREAIAQELVTREELFITSKLWVQDMKDYESAKRGIDTSLANLDLEYLDLYLLHQAVYDYFSAYRALEDVFHEGRLKAIGVSNFYPNILANLCETVNTTPAVNQVELHPYFVQNDAIETMNYYQVVPQAWAPLGGGRYQPWNNEMLQALAEKYNKTIGQIMLRWNVQRGVVVIPKSTHQERIEENFDIWDFKLTDEEMRKIASLDMGYGDTRTKHLTPDYVRYLVNYKIHD